MPLVGGEARSHRLVLICGLVLALLGATGCYRVPDGKRSIADVEIHGTKEIDDDDLLSRIDTREDARFLGLFHGVVYDYEIFDQYALRRDLQRIERYLRARGYYEAHVYAARVTEKKDRVYVTIGVIQGDPVLVDSVTIAPTTPVDEKTEKAMRIGIARILPIGAALDEDKFGESEKAALKALTSTGHAAAKVVRSAEVDLVTHRARLSYAVDPGPFANFGAVTFEGLGALPEASVRRVFGIEQGKRYSSEELDEGKQALLSLGVFATVDIVADTSAIGTTHSVPVVVKAEPSKIRSFFVGAGVELDLLKTDVHVQGGWQNANFLGGLRKLDVRYKPGVVLYPTRIDDIVAPTAPLYEHRLSTTLSQPGFIENRTTGFTRLEYNVYPVLLPKKNGEKLDNNVLGYHEPRAVVGVERQFFTRLYVSPELDVQANFPFNYLGRNEVDPLLISYAAVTTNLDLRDNPKSPRRGFWLGNITQVAGGGDAHDIRVQPDVRAYIALPKKMTLALRTSVGFLFPFNYGELSQANFRSGGAARAEGSDRDYQILFFRGFFSGGPTQNRGYPLRGVGPHDSIPYLSPAGQSASAGGCDARQAQCKLPTGGLSLWEATAELRVVVSGPFSTAFFCDASDVSPFLLDIRPNYPHLSCGTGARYDTPVGPIRFDIGYRIPGLQYPSSDKLEVPADNLFSTTRNGRAVGGIPIAIAFGIGEAF